MQASTKNLPFILFFLVIALFMVSLNGEKHNNDGSFRIGQKLADFSVPILGGKGNFSSEEFHGKVVVLNAFASWCLPCNAEHPAMMRFAKDNRVNLYGLAWRDREEKAEKYLKENGNPFRKAGIDENGNTTVLLGLTGVPETFILDKNGKIAFYYRSVITDDMIENEILPLIEKLENEKTN